MDNNHLIKAIQECADEVEKISIRLGVFEVSSETLIDLHNLKMALGEISKGLKTSAPKPIEMPSVGRIVHYTNFGDRDGKYPPEIQAAIITKVYNDFEVSLHVFYPTGDFHMDKVRRTAAKPGSENARGYWNWPERT